MDCWALKLCSLIATPISQMWQPVGRKQRDERREGFKFLLLTRSVWAEYGKLSSRPSKYAPDFCASSLLPLHTNSREVMHVNVNETCDRKQPVANRATAF